MQNTNFNKVREFHEAFGLAVNEKSEDKLFDNDQIKKIKIFSTKILNNFFVEKPKD